MVYLSIFFEYLDLHRSNSLSLSVFSTCLLEHVLYFFLHSPYPFMMVTLERVVTAGHGVLFCGWMDGVLAIFQCRSLAYGGDVYVILIMGV
jgi:hypothetical protein